MTLGAQPPNPGEPSGFVRRRIIDPVIALLKQGATPPRIAASMAVGAVVGMFPILGTTTAICFVLAFVFRLNIAAIQILNYLVYPAQLALIIPFIRLGERLFGAPHLPLSLSQLVAMFQKGTFQAIGIIWKSLLYAGAAWALFAIPAIGLLYLILLPIVRRTAAAYVATRGRA